jgi:uncharacterized membrane protein YphA (DoxX/SURF4 family)
MIRNNVIKTIVILLATLLAYAAVGKLEHPDLFRSQLGVVPAPLNSWLVWMIPILELVIALQLLFPVFRITGFFGALFLLSAYTLYLTWLVQDDFGGHCHCGTPWPGFSLRSNILINLLSVGVAGAGVALTGWDRAMHPFVNFPITNSKRPVMKVVK